jgi:peptidyl-prolyl cis-trans isomerase C
MKQAMGIFSWLALLAGQADAPVGETPSASAVAGDQPAAIVNGEPISLAEVEQVLKQNAPSPTPLTQTQRRQQRFEALTMLMDDLLLRQFLQKQAPAVDPAEVDQELANLQANLHKNKPGYSLEDFCRDSGQTEAQLRRDLLHMLQWAGYVKGRVSEADLRKYYDDYREFFDHVQVRASHIVLRLPADAPEADVAAARHKLVELRQQILAGTLSFADAARQHSQCQSAADAGDIGYFSRKWMLEESFARTAFAMKVGEVSEPIRTDFGLHLIQVTDRKAGQPSEYEKVKDEVRDYYIEEMRLNLLAELRKNAQVQINLP